MAETAANLTDLEHHPMAEGCSTMLSAVKAIFANIGKTKIHIYYSLKPVLTDYIEMIHLVVNVTEMIHLVVKLYHKPECIEDTFGINEFSS